MNKNQRKRQRRNRALFRAHKYEELMLGQNKHLYYADFWKNYLQVINDNFHNEQLQTIIRAINKP